MATRRWISTGSGDWAATGNWSGGAVPTSGDTVVFEKNQYAVSGSLNQSAVTNVSLVVHASYTGTLGDADNYLQLGCSSVEVGRDDEGQRYPGSARLNLDIGTVASTVTIINTGMIPADTGFMPMRLLANNNTTAVRIRKGCIEIAGFTGETSTIDDIEIGDDASGSQQSKVTLGAGVTMDDLNARGGRSIIRCAVDAMNVWQGASVQTEGSGTIATCRVRGGTMVANSTGTITAATVSDGGTLDTLQSPAARTISGLTVYGPSVFKKHPNVTVTGGVVLATDKPLTVAVS